MDLTISAKVTIIFRFTKKRQFFLPLDNLIIVINYHCVLLLYSLSRGRA